jgi:tyrosyl-tRNA synthetase
LKPVAEQLEQIGRGVSDVIPESELRTKLEKQQPLRVKFGVDPTAPDIHLGHTVPLSKLRQFQDLGHTAVLIIGDFTARIGDPSGRSATRPQLDEAAVRAAAETYTQQVFKILDSDRVEVRYNSAWLAGLDAQAIVKLTAQTTVARMLERDDFAKRYREEAPIGVHEFLYPLFQAHDSVVVRADVELGGTDQTFNLLLARQLQKAAGQEPQVAVVLPLLEGTDGSQKMSKSLDNHIGVAEPAEEIFGKAMSVSDDLMYRYWELLYGRDAAALRRDVENGQAHPMDLKKELAETLAARFQGAAAAAAARAAFEQRFQKREIDRDAIAETRLAAAALPDRLPALLHAVELVSSNSDGRRMMAQGAVRIEGEVVRDEAVSLAAGRTYLIQVGKRRAIRLTVV